MAHPLRFRSSIILGGVGAVAPWLYPGLLSLVSSVYGLAASGHLSSLWWELYRIVIAHEGPSMPSNTSFLALSLLLLAAPLAWAVFFVALYRDSARQAVTLRRIASGLSAAFMLVAILSRITIGSLELAVEEHPGFSGAAPFAIRAGTSVVIADFGAWLLLFLLFAASRSPLRRAPASWLALVLAATTSLQVAFYVYVVIAGSHDLTAFRAGRLDAALFLQAAVRIAGWVLLFVFLAALVRETRSARQIQPPSN